MQLLLAVIYVSFVSLGLPDSLLGAAWPSIYPQIDVPVSYAGIISMLIAAGTIVSSLNSDRLTLRFGTGKVTATSVAMTAVALLGFSFSTSFLELCLWAIPYGLGAGSVDASLNNFVALHYKSRHMSWLHCMWGVGASLGPYIMGYALTGHAGWAGGYRIIGLMQIGLAALLFISHPLWKKTPVIGVGDANSAPTNQADADDRQAWPHTPLTLGQIRRIRGAKAGMFAFFCYCAIEATVGLWAASYLNIHRGVSVQDAASYAAAFFVGITVGRALSGFLTIRFTDDQMIKAGEALIIIGVATMVIPGHSIIALMGLVVIGLGCAPVYPSIIHATPARFGVDKSQAIIGVQMASAYVGTLAMPPIFGLIANHVSVALLPYYLMLLLFAMAVSHRLLLRSSAKNTDEGTV